MEKSSDRHGEINWLCIEIKKDHRTNLVIATYDIHTKANLAKIA